MKRIFDLRFLIFDLCLKTTLAPSNRKSKIQNQKFLKLGN